MEDLGSINSSSIVTAQADDQFSEAIFVDLYTGLTKAVR
jgi:hypothetical protein